MISNKLYSFLMKYCYFFGFKDAWISWYCGVKKIQNSISDNQHWIKGM